MQHLALLVLWIIYCVLHSVLASAQFKRRAQVLLGVNFRYYRIFYTLFAFFFLAALIYFQVKLKSPVLFQPGKLLMIAAIIISLSGLIIMFICITKYFFSLSGLQSLFTERKGNQLIVSGIHRYVRHPLYLGTFLFIWGLFLLLPYLSLMIANFVITVYTVIAIKFEEQKLIDEFGEAYTHYQNSVPKLIPRLKTRHE